MIMTRVEVQRLLDKIDTSGYPWKHELSYLRETVDDIFDKNEKLLSEVQGLNDQIFEMGMSQDLE